MFIVREDDLSSIQTQDLLALHLAGMRANTPPEHVFALDLSGLKAPGVTVWSAWEGDRICGIGALKHLDPLCGEVKSMRTHPDFLGQGVGRLLLHHIAQQARARGMKQLSLETGTSPDFDAAARLYRSYGFTEGTPFADYQPSAFNQFMHLTLS